MTIESVERERLVNDIKEMRIGSIEQMALITYYSLASYFKSLLVFGRKNKVTRDNLNVIKEMYKILRQEDKLLRFILKNVDKVDIWSASHVVATLDDINDKTVEYYYDVIEEIEDACDLNEERRGIRPRKGFDTLIQSRSYASQVIALVEDIESIKKFLGYEEEFWNFIKPCLKTANVNLETMANMFYALPIYDQDGKVHSINLLVPEVVDLESALLAIKLYEEAYHIYKSLGTTYQKDSVNSKTIQEKYESEYLPNKAEQLLKFKNVK